jgi:hypothetical protein
VINVDINLKGIAKLDNTEISNLNKLANEFKEILERDFSYVKDCGLTIDVKKLAKGGKARFDISMRVEGDKFFEANQGDWDLNMTLRKTFENLVHELGHKYKKK